MTTPQLLFKYPVFVYTYAPRVAEKASSKILSPQ